MKGTEEERVRFAKGLVGLAEFYNRELSENLIEMWFTALREYKIEDFERSCVLWLKHPERSRFWPQPGELISLTGGSAELSALEAWEKVGIGVRRAGAYGSIIFDDPIIHELIRTMGGWQHFCRVPIGQEQNILRSQFVKHYIALYGRELPPQEVIPGLEEISCQSFPEAKKPIPYIIGNPEKLPRQIENKQERIFVGKLREDGRIAIEHKEKGNDQ